MHIERTFSLTKNNHVGTDDHRVLQESGRKHYWDCKSIVALQVKMVTKMHPRHQPLWLVLELLYWFFLLSRWSFTHSLTHSPLMFNSSRFDLQNSTLLYSNPVRDFSMFETWLLTLLASYNPPGEPCYCLHLFLWVLLPLLLLFLSILAFSMTIVASFNSLILQSWILRHPATAHPESICTDCSLFVTCLIDTRLSNPDNCPETAAWPWSTNDCRHGFCFGCLCLILSSLIIICTLRFVIYLKISYVILMLNAPEMLVL